MKHHRATIKTNREKEALRLQGRYNELCHIKWSHPKVKLEEPLRRGWKRYFVLRHDVAQSCGGSNVRQLRRLLDDLLQNVVVCSRHNFTEKDYKTNKFVDIEQNLRGLTERQYLALDAVDQKLFIFRIRREKPVWGKGPDRVIREWILRDPWVFCFRIEPNFITELPALLPEVDAEMHWINDQLYGWPKLWRYLPHGHDSNHGYYEALGMPPQQFRAALAASYQED